MFKIKIKKAAALFVCVLGLSGMLISTSSTADARTGGPESTMNQEEDIWCEGDPTNCGGDIIVEG